MPVDHLLHDSITVARKGENTILQSVPFTKNTMAPHPDQIMVGISEAAYDNDG